MKTIRGQNNPQIPVDLGLTEHWARGVNSTATPESAGDAPVAPVPAWNSRLIAAGRQTAETRLAASATGESCRPHGFTGDGGVREFFGWIYPCDRMGGARPISA